MYKIVFIDVDGTLVNSQLQIGRKTIKECKKAAKKGLICVINSGRNRKIGIKLSKKIGAKGYLISSTGAEIYDYKNKKIIHSKTIESSTVKIMFDLANEYKCKLRMISNGKVFVNTTDFCEKKANEILLKCDIDTFLNNNLVTQAVMIGDDYKALQILFDKVANLPGVKIGNYAKSIFEPDTFSFGFEFGFFDIIPKEINKAYGVEKLCEYLNINASETVAIGDDFNDIDMFNVVGYKIAMKNAREEVKKMADFITDTNLNDGVGKAVEHIMKLNNE